MRILVADDSAFLRGAVRRLLEPEGYEVVEAEDGVEAITKIFEEIPRLILLDVTMPRLTGYVACRLIKEDPQLASIPVLILTARDSAEDRYWAQRSGADGFLTKDALGEGLVAAINSALATHALMQLNGLEDALPPVLGEVDVLSRVCAILDRKLFEATITTELLSLTNAVGQDAILTTVFEHLGRVVAFDVGAVAVPETHQIHVLSPVDLAEPDIRAVDDFALRQLSTITGAKRHDLFEVEWIAPPAELDDDKRGWGSWYASPIRLGGTIRGLLVLAARKHGVFDQDALSTLRTLDPVLTRTIATAIDHIETRSAHPDRTHQPFRVTSL